MACAGSAGTPGCGAALRAQGGQLGVWHRGLEGLPTTGCRFALKPVSRILPLNCQLIFVGISLLCGVAATE